MLSSIPKSPSTMLVGRYSSAPGVLPTCLRRERPGDIGIPWGSETVLEAYCRMWVCDPRHLLTPRRVVGLASPGVVVVVAVVVVVKEAAVLFFSPMSDRPPWTWPGPARARRRECHWQLQEECGGGWGWWGVLVDFWFARRGHAAHGITCLPRRARHQDPDPSFWVRTCCAWHYAFVSV